MIDLNTKSVVKEFNVLDNILVDFRDTNVVWRRKEVMTKF